MKTNHSSPDSLKIISIISGIVLMGMLIWGVTRFLRRNPGVIGITARRIMKKGHSALSAPDATVKDWDQGELIHRVTGSLFGFLIMEYILLWITVSLAMGGFRSLFDLENLLCAGMFPIFALASARGIIGSLIFVAATFYGIRQDYHAGRMRALGLVALSGILMGLGM